MKKMSFKKYTSEQLRAKLIKCYRVQERTGQFYELEAALAYELAKRARARIFHAACICLKNKNFPNQFAAAAHYADAVINGSDFFVTDDHHEIGSFYTKGRIPCVVYF